MLPLIPPIQPQTSNVGFPGADGRASTEMVWIVV